MLPPANGANIPPRSIGRVELVARGCGSDSVLDELLQKGAFKVLFPRGPGVQAVLLNTSGGATGGDRFEVDVTAKDGSLLTLTTQAAERAYCAASGTARFDNRLTVKPGATLNWLPQETILFDGSDLTRRLTVNMDEGARLLMVEPLVFGRVASGERLNHAQFSDEISVYRDGRPLYLDRTRLTGDVTKTLGGAAVGRGATAMVNLVHICPTADRHLDWIRNRLPETGGVSLRDPDCLVLRLLAEDSFALRKTLLPILDRLSDDNLPKCWRL